MHHDEPAVLGFRVVLTAFSTLLSAAEGVDQVSARCALRRLRAKLLLAPTLSPPAGRGRKIGGGAMRTNRTRRGSSSIPVSLPDILPAPAADDFRLGGASR